MTLLTQGITTRTSREKIFDLAVFPDLDFLLVPPILAQSGSKMVASEMCVGNSEKRESLYGLEGVCLVVEGLNPVIEKNGLLTSRLQTDVEEELSKAGIPVLPRSEVGPMDPFLYVNVNAHKLDELFFYSIRVELHQSVTLVRDPSIEMQATPWDVGSVGSVGSANLYQIREAVKEYIREFISAYKVTSVS